MSSQVAIVQAGPYLSTTNKLTLAAAPTPGNLLLAFGINSTGPAAVTAPDGTWTPLFGAANGTTNNAWMGAWVHNVASGDGTSFTFTGASRGRVLELNNSVIAANEPLGYAGLSYTTASAGNLTSASVTPLEASDLAIACFQPLSTGVPSNTWTPNPGGFTQLDVSTNGSAKTEFATLTSPTANAALSTTEHVGTSNNLMMGLVVIKTSAVAPTASVSVPGQVDIGAKVTVDGSGSAAPVGSGDSLSYLWSVAGPQGSQASFSSSTAVTPTITPDLRGSYTFTLMVTDNTTGKTATASAVTVVVGPTALVVLNDGSLKTTAIYTKHNGVWA